MHITSKLPINTILDSENLAELLPQEDLNTIGSRVVEEYKIDLESRSPWEARTKRSLELALQVLEKKTFPWEGASNVKFPLITVAALQFHARAYPALISGNDLVKCRVVGEDPTGEKTARARRVGSHMTYQLLEEDDGWEDQMDKVLITLPIVGSAFKKSYFDSIRGHNVSEYITANDLVIPYYAKDLSSAARLTHVLTLSQNDIWSRVRRGLFRDLEEATNPLTPPTILQEARDKAQGVIRPYSDLDAPVTVLEQHRLLDLDGDGYAEPYIVFVELSTSRVLRIVPRFFEGDIQYTKSGSIQSIEAIQYFTKYSMVPSPDGGIYDLGFGVLLGPLNESINTLINQLIDSGTMAITAGGFLGRGARLRSGQNSFAPFEWKRVDSTGDDLRKNIFPLPVRDPSNVLFTLLSLLINYGERIGGSVDILSGQNPGQNTPAETTRTMAEQGMKIFSGIFKRVYRSLKEEFRKLYRLNQLYLPLTQDYEDLTSGDNAIILLSDYSGSPSKVRPAADPNIVSEAQAVLRAQALLEVSVRGPGYNHYEVHRRYLEALKVPAIEQVLPNPKGPNAVPPMPNPKLQIEQLKQQSKQLDSQVKMKLGMLKLLQEADVNRAKIVKLEAEAIKVLKEADGVETGHAIALINAQIGAAKAHQDGLLKAIELIQKSMESVEEGGKGEGGKIHMPELPEPQEDIHLG
ncbi:MAG: hypothetical protein KGL39_09970 [Patescibacteria group bacterium]|nr:hypothetical protein [Patescibacteria group bacterium]